MVMAGFRLVLGWVTWPCSKSELALQWQHARRRPPKSRNAQDSHLNDLLRRNTKPNKATVTIYGCPCQQPPYPVDTVTMSYMHFRARTHVFSYTELEVTLQQTLLKIKRSRAQLETLIAVQLINKFLVFCVTRKLLNKQKGPKFDPILASLTLIF